MLSVPLRAPAPHLDIHQDDGERRRFRHQFGVPEFPGSDKLEPNVLNGDLDTEDERLGVILGLWKPLHPDHVSTEDAAALILWLIFTDL